jgi:hypothetical protein
MRIRVHSRVWIAALLLCVSLAPPAAASEDPSVGSKIFDCAVLRPLGFAATLIGGAFFVPAAALAVGGGVDGVREAWQQFVIVPVENTFTRPLGEF